MADVTLTRPQSQQNVTIDAQADSRLVLNFPMDAAMVEKEGDHLVFAFSDGGRVTLNNFYKSFSQASLPEFQIGGQTVAGSEFFSALGENLMPAAAPAVQAAVPGAGSSADFGSATLLGGLERLEGVDLKDLTTKDALEYIQEHPEDFANLPGLSTTPGQADTGKGDVLLGGAGSDVIYGQGGDDVIFGGGDEQTLGKLGQKLGVDVSGLGKPGQGAVIDNLVEHIQSMDNEAHDKLGELGDWAEANLGSKTDGNNFLFGGEGDDVIFGGAGNEYIDGGKGADIIFAGSGNDIVRYDAEDIFVDGGSGVDFLVGVKADDLSTILGENSKVTDFEVIVMDGGATSLTNMKDFEAIGLSLNASGKLSMSEDWTINTSADLNVSDEYVAYSHDDVTILVQKSILESNG